MTVEPLVKEIFIEATPEEVFPYVTQSEMCVLWMGVAAELEPVPGGILKIDLNASNGIDGRFLEVAPPNRVNFTWGFRDPEFAVPAGSTRVEIELTAQDGGTLLRLTHHGLPGGGRARFEAGWSHYLGRMKTVLAGGDPGRDEFGGKAKPA